MTRTETFVFGLVCAISSAAFTTGVLKLKRLDNQRDCENCAIETKLSDGTPCALNKNGGIACDWRRNGEQK